MLEEDTTFIQSRSALFVLQEKTLSLLPADNVRPAEGFSLAAGDVVEQKYEILQLLGEGGMGAVYKAHHRSLDKIVALKTFKTAQIDGETVLRFQREARALAKLSHPNIVEIYDYGTTESKVPYYTMEYLEGQSLADLLKGKGRLSISETVGIFFQICHGLGAAHLKGILHRDLKPSNIFLTAAGAKQYKVSVVDFGLAVMTSAQADELGVTMQGVICGSPLYMSPEQGRAEPLTAASDIYSLGCTLYECLTGRAPFVGGSSLHTMMLRETEIAPTLTASGDGKIFPPELEKIVATMLQKDPSRRQPSIEIVLDDLDYFARSRKKAKSQSLLPPAQSSKEPEPTSKKQQKLLWSSIAAISLSAVGLTCAGIFVPKAPPIVAKHLPRAAGAQVLPTTALPICSMSADGKTGIIEWPGHLVGREIDQPGMQKDRLTWDDTKPYCICFSDEFFADPRNFLGLKNVRIRKIFFQKQLPKADLTQILQNLRGQKQLSDLHFEGQLLDDKDLLLLADVPDLSNLTLTYAKTVSAEALARLALKKNLSGLTYDFSGGRASALLRKLPLDKNLQHLSVSGYPLTVEDLKNISSMSGVGNLRILQCGLTDEKLKLLMPLKGVWALRVQNNPLTPACIPTLQAWACIVESTLGRSFSPILSSNDSWQQNDIKHLKKVLPSAQIEEVQISSSKPVFDKAGNDFLRDSFR